MTPATKTVEFKVDLVWKIVVLGAVALAARMSWSAWESSQIQVRQNAEAIGKLTTLAETGEIRLQYLERTATAHSAILDTLRGFPEIPKSKK